MKDLKNTSEKKKILKAINSIEKYKEEMIEEEINVSHYRGREKYYIRFKNDEGKYVRSYISKKDKRIKSLATKKYYKNLEPVIRKELKALEKQEKDYWPNRKYEVYEELGELKEFVKPLFIDERNKEQEEIDRKVKNWIKNNTYSEDFMEEGKKFKTRNGDATRSKSEWMIIAMLDQYSDYLRYVYEPELYLPGSGLVRPDFELISLKTGNIYYWEHVGMIGDENYASRFVEKINAYARAGYFPGKNLLLSFETATRPLNTEALEHTISEFFVEV